MFLSGMLARAQHGVKTAPTPTLLRAALRWAPAIAWMAGIFYLSHQSSPVTLPGDASLAATESALAHLFLYGVLASLLAWPLAQHAPRCLRRLVPLLAALGSVLYGATDELHQAFVPGRNASLTDLGYDALGAALAMGLLWTIVLLYSVRQPPRREP